MLSAWLGIELPKIPLRKPPPPPFGLLLVGWLMSTENPLFVDEVKDGRPIWSEPVREPGGTEGKPKVPDSVEDEDDGDEVDWCCWCSSGCLS